MSWADRTQNIKVGDRVCYSRTFLQSTGQYTGEIPFARGTVTAIKHYGSMAIAEIDWNNDEIPAKVNVLNLSRVTEKGILE